MRHKALWLTASLVVLLGACDQTPKGPPAANAVDSTQNAVPEAVPFVEPPANEQTSNLAAPSNSVEPTAAATPADAAGPARSSMGPPATTVRVPFGDPQDVVATDRTFRARQKRLEGLVDNAASRDANGEAQARYEAALPDRNNCGSRDCLNAWYAREEAALSKWEGAAEILAQPLK